MIARKSLLVFGNNIVGAILGVVAMRLVAQYLGLSLVDPVEFAFGLFGLLYFLTDLGFGAAHTKRVSEGMDEGDCLATFAYFKLFATVAFLVIGGGIVGFVVLARPNALQDATPGVLLLVLANYGAKSVLMVPYATFDAKRETARGQLAFLFDTLARIGATVLLAMLYAGLVRQRGPLAGAFDPEQPAIAWILGNPSAALAGTYLLGTLTALTIATWYVRRTARFGRFRADILRSYAQFALPIALIGAVAVMATNIDRAALGFFGAQNEAGLYAYARKITMFIETLPVAVAALLFPTISGYHGRGDDAAIGEVRTRAARYISMIVAPLCVFLIVFAPQIIHLFLSDEWLPAVPAMRILALFSLVYALTIPYTTVLTGTGRTREAARIAGAIAVLNIVLNVVLIPQDLRALGLPGVRLAGLGVTGAAIATLASMTVGHVFYRRVAAEFVPTKDGFVLRHLAAAVVMAGVVVGLEQAVIGLDPLAGELAIRWYHLLAFGLAGGAAYAAVLAALRELTRADVRWFLDTLHPGEMVDYVLAELHLKRRR